MHASCALYPAPPPSLLLPQEELLTVVGVWHDAPKQWRLYAQIKHYQDACTDFISLVGATQLYPLGENTYRASPATTLLQALEVPRGQESYATDAATSRRPSDNASKLFPRTPYPRFAPFTAAIEEVLELSFRDKGAEIVADGVATNYIRPTVGHWPDD